VLRARLLAGHMPGRPAIAILAPLTPTAGVSDAAPIATVAAPIATMAAPAASDATRPVAAARSLRPEASPAKAANELVITGPELSSFLEETYRPFLPAAAGTLSARAEGDLLTLESQVDLARLVHETDVPLPALVASLGDIQPTVRVSGRLIASGGGVARLRLERVHVAGIAIPRAALRQFVAAELKARGFVADDPLIRPFHLPAGWESAALDDGQLLLRAR